MNIKCEFQKNKFTKFKLDIVQDCTKLDDDWVNKIPKNCFLHKDSVSLTQQSELSDIEYFYIKVIENNKVILFAYMQKFYLKKQSISCENQWLQVFASNMISVFKPSLLVAGHLFRHDIETFYFVDDTKTDFEKSKIIQVLADKIMAKYCCTGTLLKDINRNYYNYFLHHQKKFQVMKKDISMTMDIPKSWIQFDDYLLALKHKYKQRAKKILEKKQFFYKKNLSLEELISHKDNIERYYKELLNEQNVVLGTINFKYLYDLKKYNNEFKVYGIFENETNTLIGFYSLFEKTNIYDMFYLGFDTKLNRQWNIYFNVLFWALESAIDLKKEKLILGRTALDAKAVVGCKPEYTQNFYSIKNFFLEKITNRIQNQFLNAQGENWESRHPFSN